MNIKEKKNFNEDAFYDAMADLACAPVFSVYSLAYDHIEEIFRDKSILSQRYTFPLYQMIKSWNLDLNGSIFKQIYLAKQCQTVEQFMKTFEIKSVDQLAIYCKLSFAKSIRSIKKKEVFNEVKKDLIFGFVFSDALDRHFKAELMAKFEEQKRKGKGNNKQPSA